MPVRVVAYAVAYHAGPSCDLSILINLVRDISAGLQGN